MPLEFFAGQRLTADALQRVVPDRVLQDNDQSVASSAALVNSEIAITVDGLIRIDLEVRWTSGGGGMRWDWADSGSVSFVHRAVGAPGNAAAGSPTDLSSMTWLTRTDFATDTASAHFSTSSLQRISETLVVDGTGTLTFRFAQQASNAADTTIFANSYALVTRLGS